MTLLSAGMLERKRGITVPTCTTTLTKAAERTPVDNLCNEYILRSPTKIERSTFCPPHC